MKRDGTIEINGIIQKYYIHHNNFYITNPMNKNTITNYRINYSVSRMKNSVIKVYVKGKSAKDELNKGA